MSTDTTTEGTTLRESSGGLLDRFREQLFWLGMIVGVILFALGLAFLLLAFTLSTDPPAPYFASITDRYLLAAVALGVAVLGAGAVRGALKLAGW